MTSEHPTYPELNAADERHDALLQMQLYEAMVIAAKDVPAVLDSVLEASTADVAHDQQH